MEDIYQQRYLDHQAQKKRQLESRYGCPLVVQHSPDTLKAWKTLVRSRRSQRNFNREPVSEATFKSILDDLRHTPSSCNRQAVSVKVIEDRTNKELLTGLLVGGVGWCHQADKLLLLLADPQAYKENLPYMPYLDAGVLITQAYLSAEAHNVGICFINPNIRPENQDIFAKRFSPLILCGVLALGHYDRRAKSSPKRSSCLIL